MDAVVSALVVDCGEPALVAASWQSMLGGRVVSYPELGVETLRAPGVTFDFVKSPDPKISKNRWHLGCEPLIGRCGRSRRKPSELETQVLLQGLTSMLGTVLEDTVNVVREITYGDVRHAFIVQAAGRLRNPFISVLTCMLCTDFGDNPFAPPFSPRLFFFRPFLSSDA